MLGYLLKKVDLTEFLKMANYCFTRGGHSRRLPQGSPWGNSLGWAHSGFGHFCVCGHTVINCPRGRKKLECGFMGNVVVNIEGWHKS